MGDLLASLNPLAIFFALRDFVETGGPVLLWLMGITFLMWMLLIERYWYFATVFPRAAQVRINAWRDREDQTSWQADQIRKAMVSELRIEATQGLGLIKTLVAVAPLFGLLGTVTGMVEVFDVMAQTGASNARAMAAGVSKATIPTMAGMVAAISGLFFISQLDRRSRRKVQHFDDVLNPETSRDSMRRKR